MRDVIPIGGYMRPVRFSALRLQEGAWYSMFNIASVSVNHSAHIETFMVILISTWIRSLELGSDGIGLASVSNSKHWDISNTVLVIANTASLL